MLDKDASSSDQQVLGCLEEKGVALQQAGNQADRRQETTIPPYSIFTKREKMGIIVLVAYASVFSPLSSFIYYPALTAVATSLHTSLSKVNLTVTSYMIVSGVAPTILGNMADQIGRRPIYLCMFLFYMVANIGLAVQTSYPALLLLRMLQSAGASATIGIGYGVVGDISEASERGGYMGILACGPNVAPGVGPVLGGVLTQKAGWRWVFGFQAIAGLLSFVLIGILLPETARNVVGDGSGPAKGLNKSLLDVVKERKDRESPHLCSRRQSETSFPPLQMPGRGTFKIPNPLESISILSCRDTAPIIFVYAVFYTTYSCLQASLSSLFISIYDYQELEAGLIYLPFGAGCFIASLISRNILTNDYRHVAKRYGFPKSSADTSESQRLAFPIFHARLRSMIYLIPLSTLPLVAYGWVLEYRLHPSIPLILQFVIGGAITIIFNACGTLVVDLHSLRPSTAQAAVNLVRCALAAGGLAALQPLIDADMG
ncbi:hypothetical protein H2204_003694 [Knufia peltigerae]|uniref:Major facilitator superfamily (MFS) profile domain-containing protein n=1 Tax=Knufia peltigerae TaxID=1002370 RepID=A0AA38Y8Q8_9EURO|nr:hypothetical protein H2204_003694 [Knufia peltigerae]